VKSVRRFSPFDNAVLNAHKEVVELLINNGAEVNTLIKIDGEQFTLLHIAIRQNDIEIAKLLIANVANIETKSSYDWTALQHAVDEGQDDIVRFLISKGADVNVRNRSGETPLSCAVGHKQITKLLISEGAEKLKGESETPTASGYCHSRRPSLPLSKSTMARPASSTSSRTPGIC